MKTHLVISYSRADGASMSRVRDYLQSRGIQIWSDEALQPGTPSWTKAIEAAIENSLGLVVVLSPNAKGSEWVEREIRYASAQRKEIFPLLALGEQSKAIPLQLIDAEFTDIRTDFERGMALLLETIKDRFHVLEAQSRAKELLFCAQSPKVISRDNWCSVFAYVYYASASDAVAENMAQMTVASSQRIAGQAQRRERFPDSQLIPLLISPGDIPELVFNPRTITIDVRDTWQRFEFWVRAAEQCPNSIVEASIGFSLERPMELPIGQVSLSFQVEQDASFTETTIEKTAAYTRIFACYSLSDKAIVTAVSQTYLALGIDFILPVDRLGQTLNWNDQIERFIRGADIFQLFWSRAAKVSGFVEREWKYALSLVSTGEKPRDFIRPVYWETPVPLPPPELSHLHFAYNPGFRATPEQE
jgi:hypothetical protein